MSNEAKSAVWKAYRDRRPVRVPVVTWTNPRVVILHPKWNTEGWTFEKAAKDPAMHLRVLLAHELYRRTVLNKYSDQPTGLPEVWRVSANTYNVYEAAYFGAPVRYPDHQVPDTRPIFEETNRNDLFKVDIDHPLENPFVKHWMGMTREMQAIAKGMKFEGRPVEVGQFCLEGTDGPFTVGCNLRGTDFLIDFMEDDGYAQRLMAFVMRAAINRRKAFWDLYDRRDIGGAWVADDSIALISTESYLEKVFPHHRAWFDDFDRSPRASAGAPRVMHLCGDATRHFPTLVKELKIQSFDTGFPVNFGDLRKKIGPDVEIAGGPEVALLLNSTPQTVYDRCTGILKSGIMTGGRFTLRDANNLPPNVPEANLQAMYRASLDHGNYN